MGKISEIDRHLRKSNKNTEEVKELNYIKESETILKNYRKLLLSIKNLEDRRDELLKKGGPEEIKSQNYTKPSIQKFNYSDDTFNQICEVADLNNQIKETKREVILVNKILKQIKNEDEKIYEFIKIKYVKEPKISMNCVAEKLGYSPDSNDTIYKIKEKALKEFAILYFGVNALKST